MATATCRNLREGKLANCSLMPPSPPPVGRRMLEPQEGQTIAVWFSSGAASAVAAKLAAERYGNLCDVRLVNNTVAEESPDNLRFLRDVEKWIGIEVEF